MVPSVEKLPTQVLDDVLDKDSGDDGNDDHSQAFFRDPNAIPSDSGSPEESPRIDEDEEGERMDNEDNYEDEE